MLHLMTPHVAPRQSPLAAYPRGKRRVHEYPWGIAERQAFFGLPSSFRRLTRAVRIS